MNSVDVKISEEELDLFLKEAGVFDPPPEVLPKHEESVEKLLEEIIGNIQLPPISTQPEKKLVLESLPDEKPKKDKFPIFPMLVALAFLGGILLGTTFGYYWGKEQRVEIVNPSYEELNSRITNLSEQIQEIYDKITPLPPPEEIIEPLTVPDEIATLAPETLQ